jgi:hypothetical protein
MLSIAARINRIREAFVPQALWGVMTQCFEVNKGLLAGGGSTEMQTHRVAGAKQRFRFNELHKNGRGSGRTAPVKAWRI